MAELVPFDPATAKAGMELRVSGSYLRWYYVGPLGLRGKQVVRDIGGTVVTLEASDLRVPAPPAPERRWLYRRDFGHPTQQYMTEADAVALGLKWQDGWTEATEPHLEAVAVLRELWEQSRTEGIVVGYDLAAKVRRVLGIEGRETT